MNDSAVLLIGLMLTGTCVFVMPIMLNLLFNIQIEFGIPICSCIGAICLILYLNYKELKKLNVQDKDGYTTLIFASLNKNIQEVEKLLKQGADPNIQDNDGYTALIYASLKGYKEIIELLLEYGADIDIQTNSGSTALIWCSIISNNEIVKLLLDKGARLDIKDKNDNTALDWAYKVKNNSENVINLIKKY